MAYQALYYGAAMADAVNKQDLAVRCLSMAPVLKNTYVKSLYNPDTGWFAGWRSRDGKLHDYAFLYINGMAVSYGIIEGKFAHDVIKRLE